MPRVLHGPKAVQSSISYMKNEVLVHWAGSTWCTPIRAMCQDVFGGGKSVDGKHPVCQKMLLLLPFFDYRLQSGSTKGAPVTEPN